MEWPLPVNRNLTCDLHNCQAILPCCPMDIISAIHGPLEDYFDEPVVILSQLLNTMLYLKMFLFWIISPTRFGFQNNHLVKLFSYLLFFWTERKKQTKNKLNAACEILPNCKLILILVYIYIYYMFYINVFICILCYNLNICRHAVFITTKMMMSFKLLFSYKNVLLDYFRELCALTEN